MERDKMKSVLDKGNAWNVGKKVAREGHTQKERPEMDLYLEVSEGGKTLIGIQHLKERKLGLGSWNESSSHLLPKGKIKRTCLP